MVDSYMGKGVVFMFKKFVAEISEQVASQVQDDGGDDTGSIESDLKAYDADFSDDESSNVDSKSETETNSEDESSNMEQAVKPLYSDSDGDSASEDGDVSVPDWFGDSDDDKVRKGETKSLAGHGALGGVADGSETTIDEAADAASMAAGRFEAALREYSEGDSTEDEFSGEDLAEVSTAIESETRGKDGGSTSTPVQEGRAKDGVSDTGEGLSVHKAVVEASEALGLLEAALRKNPEEDLEDTTTFKTEGTGGGGSATSGLAPAAAVNEVPESIDLEGGPREEGVAQAADGSNALESRSREDTVGRQDPGQAEVQEQGGEGVLPPDSPREPKNRASKFSELGKDGDDIPADQQSGTGAEDSDKPAISARKNCFASLFCCYRLPKPIQEDRKAGTGQTPKSPLLASGKLSV